MIISRNLVDLQSSQKEYNIWYRCSTPGFLNLCSAERRCSEGSQKVIGSDRFSWWSKNQNWGKILKKIVRLRKFLGGSCCSTYPEISFCIPLPRSIKADVVLMIFISSGVQRAIWYNFGVPHSMKGWETLV